MKKMSMGQKYKKHGLMRLLELFSGENFEIADLKFIQKF